jgi:hypothetical protein
LSDRAAAASMPMHQGKHMGTIHKPFKYVPSLQTDIRQTIRREQARLRALQEAQRAAPAANVTPLSKGKARSA